MTAYAPLIKSIPFEQFHPLRENRFKYTESEDFFRSKSENEVEGRLLHRYSIASKPSYRKRKKSQEEAEGDDRCTKRCYVHHPSPTIKKGITTERKIDP